MATAVMPNARVVSRILSADVHWKTFCACGNALPLRRSNICLILKAKICSHSGLTRKIHTKLKRSSELHKQHYKLLSNQASHDLQKVDIMKELSSEIDSLSNNIKQELNTSVIDLRDQAHYYFDGQGKSFRPMVVMLMARACNKHNGVTDSLLQQNQKKVAMIAEMIHTASLIHDDVIDCSDTRRGKQSMHISWGHRKAVLCGDYILSVSSMLLASLGSCEVVKVLSQVIADLVTGEFMQLGSKENENERFAHYLEKTYKKTASLIANSCKAIAILGNSDDKTKEIAYEYGRNIGLAFQLVDDLLDFVSSDQIMGKPTAADLRLGLATAPVLFAALQHPELNAMIMRRFNQEGDVETARDMVAKSDGISQTRILAEQHCKGAINQISQLEQSPEQQVLIELTQKVLNRLK